MSAAAAPLAGLAPSSPFRIGRPFVHPLFDLLIIGGGLSLLLPLLLGGEGRQTLDTALVLYAPLLILLSNNAHFASSTVRLYAKPGATREWTFLTLGFPLVSVAILSLAVAVAERLGPTLQALYLTWSPFHYAAQAYGLSLMYGYRSGCAPTPGDKRLLRAACLMPFGASFVGNAGTGVEWLAPGPWLQTAGGLAVRARLLEAFSVLAVAVPIALLVRQRMAGRVPLPLISWCVVASNAVWLVTLNRLGAFAWATVFHGLQYLAIVTIFHVKDQARLPGNRRGPLAHAAAFYAASLLLGYLLFQVWPFAYVLLGYGIAESMLLVAAIINLHHFIVDAFIWKLRQAPNLRIVTEASGAA